MKVKLTPRQMALARLRADERLKRNGPRQWQPDGKKRALGSSMGEVGVAGLFDTEPLPTSADSKPWCDIPSVGVEVKTSNYTGRDVHLKLEDRDTRLEDVRFFVLVRPNVSDESIDVLGFITPSDFARYCHRATYGNDPAYYVTRSHLRRPSELLTAVLGQRTLWGE